MLFFQLPVGALADRIGRKRTVVLTEGFRTAGILGYGLATSLAGYVVANVIWSFAAAFSVGTSAYLYETLMEAGHEAEFPRYISRNTMIQLLSNAAGSLVGAGLVSVTGSLQLTLLLGAVINVAAVSMAMTFVEPGVERHTEPTYTKQLAQGLRIVRRREGVALLIGIQVFLGVTLYLMAIFRSPYLRVLGLLPADIGVWVSGFLLVAAFASAFAGRLSDRLGELGMLSLLVVLAVVPFFGMWAAGGAAWAVLLQVPIFVVWSLEPPIVAAYLHRRLEPGQRATVLSMGTFAYTFGLVIVEPLAGLTMTATGLLDLGLFLGLLTLVPCAYILVRWRTTVAPWPAITPVPSRLVPEEARVSRFLRPIERLLRLRP